jgi:hypothetical protein
MKTGTELIAEERQRQITAEGYTAEQDDKMEDGDLALAAVCYATNAVGELDDGNPLFEAWWPWDNSYWKPTPGDEIRQLVKAGALIAAEIDRLLRKEE